MSDTTDAAAHVEAIRAALDDGYDPLDDWEYLSAKNRDAICDHVAALDAARVAAEQRADAAEAERNCLDQLVSHLRGIGQSNARDTQVYWESVDRAYQAVYGDLNDAPAPGRAEGGA